MRVKVNFTVIFTVTRLDTLGRLLLQDGQHRDAQPLIEAALHTFEKVRVSEKLLRVS